MNGEENGEVGASPYWDTDDAEYDTCDCPGPPPPPQFVIPPPPPPPSLHLCRGGDHHSELQHCHMEPIGAEYTQAAFPSLPIIAVCSSVVLVAILVASFLLWKHKKKVQNFLPCKADHQGRCDISSSNGVTYDDVLINHHPTRLPAHHTSDTHTLTPIELLDVKYVSYVQHHLEALSFAPPHKESTRSHHKNKEHFNPIYEEVSGGSDDKVGSRSYDSDIEDSEVEARTVASEDEFAEDELSVAEAPRDENQPYSGTSSMQGSTGGHLYPDIASGSSERFSSDGSNSDTRAFKELLRRSDGEGKAHSSKKQHSHSLERNKDRNTFQAKHNYYLNKIMLGPDLTYPDVTNGTDSHMSRSGSGSQRDSGVPYSGNSMDLDIVGQSPSVSEPLQYPRTLGSLNVSAILHPAGALLASRSSPPPPPYTTRPSPGSVVREGISALYNPHSANPPSLTSSASTASSSSKPGRVTPVEPLLSELTFKFPATGTRSLPVPHCRGGGTVLFSGDNPPYSPHQLHHHQQQAPHHPQQQQSSSSRARSGSASEFLSFHPYPGGRAPTPPPSENIYASIEDDGSGGVSGGPFTIDGSRHRGTFSSSRKTAGGLKTPFIRAGPLMRPLGPRETGKGTARGQANHIPLQRGGGNGQTEEEDNGSYGDIRPVYDSRTACT